MFCKKCGKENISSSKFCKSCGNVLTGAVVQSGIQPGKMDAKTKKMIFGIAGFIMAGYGLFGLHPWVITYQIPSFDIIYPDGTPLFIGMLVVGLICLYIASKIKIEV